MKIFIIGLPGSGKSTLGEKLANHLDIPFLDLDERIESAAGQPIRKIFADQGEAAFRKLEQRALQRIINTYDCFVLATGGGAPCFFDNLDIMNQAGTTLFLDVPIPTIVARMHGSQVTDRPLLQGLDQKQLVEEYTAKFEKRLPMYGRAQVVIDRNTAVKKIAAQLITRN